jgi:putative redox protein
MAKIKIRALGNLKTECVHDSGAKILTDAATGLSPTDVIAAGLDSCMLSMMDFTAKKMGIDLTGMTAEVAKEMAEGSPRRIGRIQVTIRSEKVLSKEIADKLEHAAKECPVHHSLNPAIRIEVAFSWGL